MSTQDKQEKAASILTHYFRRITEAAGLRWSERNETDMEQLAALLCGNDQDNNDPRPKLPPVGGKISDEEWLRRSAQAADEKISDREWLRRSAQAVGYETERPKRRNDR